MKHLTRSAALAAALTLGAAACSRNEAPGPATAGAPVAAATAVARIEEVPDILVLTGTVQPTSRVVLAPKVMGRILKIAAKEGDVVRKGQVLVEIDGGDLAAAAAQAEAAVEAAKAAEENAAIQRDRMRDLESRQAATRKNREDAEMGHAVAAAQRRQAESALGGARAMLAFATLTSPVAGVVTGKQADEGSMAAPGAPILTLEETGRMKVEAALPESETAVARLGAPVTVSFDAGGLAPRSAVITEVLPAADPMTRTFLARVLLDNADGALRSGTFARLAIERGTRKALRVPREAIVERGALRGLFIAEREGASTTARLRWVRTADAGGESVEILSGLADGEAYVTRPAPDLADGSALSEIR